MESEALERWLPPEGMAGRIERFDARPGSGFRMELTYLDPADSPGKTSASRDVTEIEIAALEPDARVVWRIEFAFDDPAFALLSSLRGNYDLAAELVCLLTLSSAAASRTVRSRVRQQR